jgi:hypothetical protein
MCKMAKVTGKLTGSLERLDEVELIVEDKQGNEIATAKVGADGNYTISNLPPGTYDVKVKPPDVYLEPKPIEVTVDALNASIPDVDFALNASGDSELGEIQGQVFDIKGDPIEDVTVRATDESGNTYTGTTAKEDDKCPYTIPELPAGMYIVEVPDQQDLYPVPAHVSVGAGQTVIGIDFSQDIVQHFIGILDDARFSIETPISREEANQAVGLFAVGNLMLAGLSQRAVGGTDKTDVLGVLSLYYGLQDKSLTGRVTFQDEQDLWDSVEEELRDLASRLDTLQSDVAFLKEEIRRQFDMGTNTTVVGNVQFPVLFNRYVDIGANPLLSVDIQKAEDSPYFDKEKLEQVYDLLRDLKGVILQVVRSLSKYGTTATRRVNRDWAEFQARSLEVLAIAAKEIVAADLDAKTTWALLAELTGNDRESHVAPHVALGRHGVKLLQYAMQIYGKVETQGKIEDFDRLHLLKIFQDPEEEQFMTTLIRREAAFIRRYRLANWG